MGTATVLEWTEQAARAAAGAQRGAEIHHRLGVMVDALLRGEALGHLPQLSGDLRLAGLTVLGNVAGQHALDVAVKDRFAQVQADAGDGARRGTATARSLGELVAICGEHAALLG